MPSRSVFDGRSLTLYRSDGSIVGSWPAISGKNGDQRPSSQNRPFQGPLTEGKYSFSTDNIQPMTTLDAAMGVVGRGLFPKSVPAWGTERTALVPESRPTNGRGNFFIHGGLEPGSAGCIDLGPNEKAYFDAVRSTGESSHEVIVSYDPSLETSRHPLAGRRIWDGASEYLPRILSLPEPRPVTPAFQPDAMHSPRSFIDRFERWGTSPAGVVPERELDHPASLDQRFGNWGTRYAGVAGASSLPPVRAPDFIGPGIPLISAPAGSLVDPGGSSLLNPTPMDPGASGPFSTGGRFVPRSSSPQPLYPTGALVPTSNGRVYDRQGLLDDRSRYGNSSPADDTDSFRSPVLRELQKYRQLAASSVDTAPSSAASNLGSSRSSIGVDSEAEAASGGFLKWIGNGLVSSTEASPSLAQSGSIAPSFLGDNEGSISDANEAASPSSQDIRRYLSRRIPGQESAFDAGAPAVPVVPSNAGLAPDYPNSLEDPFGDRISTGGTKQAAQPQQAPTPLGLLTGQPMPSRVVPLPIFDLLDRSTGRESAAHEWESPGTGIPMLDEYIRYLNRAYPT